MWFKCEDHVLKRNPHKIVNLAKHITKPKSKAKAKATGKAKPKAAVAAKPKPKPTAPENEIAIDESADFQAKRCVCVWFAN